MRAAYEREREIRPCKDCRHWNYQADIGVLDDDGKPSPGGVCRESPQWEWVAPTHYCGRFTLPKAEAKP